MTWDFGSPRKIKNGDNFSISENENNIIIKAGQSAYMSINGFSKIEPKTIDNELQDYTCNKKNIYYITDIDKKDCKNSNIQIGMPGGGNYLEFSSPYCKWTNIITDSSGNNIFLIDSDGSNYYLFQYKYKDKSYSNVYDQDDPIKYLSQYSMIYKRILNNIICYVVNQNIIGKPYYNTIYILIPPSSGESKYINESRTLFLPSNANNCISCFYNNKKTPIHYIYINKDNKCYISDGTTDTLVNISNELGTFKYSTCAANEDGSFLLVTVTYSGITSDSIFYSTDRSTWKILNTIQQFSGIKQIAYVNNSIYVLDSIGLYKGIQPTILSIYGITLTNNALNITYENSVAPTTPTPAPTTPTPAPTPAPLTIKANHVVNPAAKSNETYSFSISDNNNMVIVKTSQVKGYNTMTSVNGIKGLNANANIDNFELYYTTCTDSSIFYISPPKQYEKSKSNLYQITTSGSSQPININTQSIFDMTGTYNNNGVTRIISTNDEAIKYYNVIKIIEMKNNHDISYYDDTTLIYKGATDQLYDNKMEFSRILTMNNRYYLCFLADSNKIIILYNYKTSTPAPTPAPTPVFPALAYYNNGTQQKNPYYSTTNTIISASFYTHENTIYCLYIENNKINIGQLDEGQNIKITSSIVDTSSLIYCAASRNGKYLAACTKTTVYYSTDNGTNWEKISYVDYTARLPFKKIQQLACTDDSIVVLDSDHIYQYG